MEGASKHKTAKNLAMTRFRMKLGSESHKSSLLKRQKLACD